jgi:co-chaperonin GroES (HSP10)
MAKITPFPDNFVLGEAHVGAKTSGGLIIPESDSQRPQHIGTFIGEVLSVGVEVEKKGNIKVGDILVTHRGKLKQLPLNNKTYWIAKEEDICARIDLEEDDLVDSVH